MNRALKTFGLILATLLIVTACPQPVSNTPDVHNTPMETFENFRSREQTEWVYMIYMAGDNDLEGPLYNDFNEIEQGLYNLSRDYPGRLEKIRVLAFFDRSSGYYAGDDNWSNTRFYEIKPDNQPYKIASELIANYEELDMGSASTLTLFLDKVKTYYPANNYFFSLSNHGDGVRPYIPGGLSPLTENRSRGAASDYTNNGYLYLEEMQRAFRNVEGDFFRTKRLAGIGFDCCYMGMVEVAYQFKDYAESFVGSMDLEPGKGWNYTSIFEDLNFDTLSGPLLAEKIVDDYRDDYLLSPRYKESTLAASDLNQIEGLKVAIDNLAAALYAEKKQIELEMVRERATNFFLDERESIFIPYYDLKSLCDNITTASDLSSSLKTKAAAVVTELDKVIIKGFAGLNKGNYFDKGARGLSIFFPRGNLRYGSQSHYAYHWWYSPLPYGPNDEYGQLDFLKGGNAGNRVVESWKELMEAWYDPDNSLTPEMW